MIKKSFHSENSSGNSWREMSLLHPNTPTEKALKEYNISYQFIILLYARWNRVFVLERVGITRGEVSPAVGMKNCTNRLPGSSNNSIGIQFQSFSLF
jgi:hypothetical protein